MAKSLIVRPRGVEVANVPDDYEAVQEIVGTPFTLAPYPPAVPAEAPGPDGER